MANSIDVKYIKVSDYDLDTLVKYSDVIKKRFAKSEDFKNDVSKLRYLLGGILIYKNLGDVEDKILYTKHKKPYIEGGPFFNISHSGDYIVFAKDDDKIGIDIEAIDEKNIEIANFAFNDNERNIINADASKIDALTRLWTCKESAYKLEGSDGVVIDIDVSGYPLAYFLNNKINLLSKKYRGYYITVASIKKYVDINLIEELI